MKMIPASIAPMRAHPIPIPTADPVETPPIPTKAAEVVGLKVEVEAGVGEGLLEDVKVEAGVDERLLEDVKVEAGVGEELLEDVELMKGTDGV
jgi:hypothetical protein